MAGVRGPCSGDHRHERIAASLARQTKRGRHGICFSQVIGGRSASSANGARMPTKPFHLAWFLQGSSAQAWGEAWTGHIGETWMEPQLFLNMARTLKRACFDYML